MSDRIVLGEGLTCDLAVLAETRMLINAASGGGKSRTLRRLAEQANGKIQQIIIDSEGEFASLREKYDYLLAARHGGDCIADPRAAALLAEKLLTLGVSCVVDIFDLKKSTGERKRFVRLFLEGLMSAPKRLWRPVLIELDEAHEYAPEGDESEALGPVVDLASQGRKRGFCLVAATQRLSKLSKDVAAELRNVMIGNTVLDVDMKRAADVLGFDKPARLSLRDLEAGQFWAFGPALVKAPTLITVGNVQTTHPKVGDRKALPAPPPTAKIRALLPQLADLPQEAEEKARTEAELRKELSTVRAALTRAEKAQAKSAPAAGPTPEVQRDMQQLAAEATSYRSALEAAVKFIVEVNAQDFTKAVGEGVDPEKLRAAIEAAVQKSLGIIEENLKGRRREFDAFRKQGERILASLQKVLGQRTHTVAVNVKHNQPFTTTPTVVPAPRAPKPVSAPHPAPNGDGDLSRGQRKILNALAELHVLGVEQPSRTQLGMFASYNLTGGSGAQHIADLVGLDLVEIPGAGAVRLTQKGHESAGPADAPRSLQDVHDRVYAKLSGGQRRILEHLISIHPESISRADLGEAAGYNLTGGSGAQHVADLVNLGAATIPGAGKVVASDLLFPEGLS